MYRLIQTVIICFMVLALSSQDLSAAWPFGNTKTLITINGVDYTPEDFNRWWDFWNEKKKNVPDDLDPFIEWKLLSQEARSMELEQMPAFQRKVRIYLKSRARMYFKYEEVDSRMQTVSEQDIKDRYNMDYSPIWLVTSLYFNSFDKAEHIRKGLTENKLNVEELLKSRDSEIRPIKHQQNIIRPRNFTSASSQFVAPVKDLAVGEVTAPQPYGNIYVIFQLNEQITNDPHDFAKMQKAIKEEIFKERQAQLTYALMSELQKKYDVQVDEELFTMASADLSGEILKRPIVTTTEGNIPLALLVKDIRKERKIFANSSEKVKEERKRGLLNGMILEYLITWESLARKYEEKPPLKWSYQFYIENRLIKELENILIRKQISLTDNEIEGYYQLHLDKYMGPSRVSIALMEDEKDLISKAWDEINTGQDFLQVAKRYYTNITPVKNVIVGELAPDVAEAIQDLEVGEVSPPFQLGKDYGIVKLVNRQPAEPLPLARVRKKVSKGLYDEKYAEMRQSYVEKLLEQSQIKINNNAWNKLKKELVAESKSIN
jgi:hypothetical protein